MTRHIETVLFVLGALAAVAFIAVLALAEVSPAVSPGTKQEHIDRPS